MTRQIILDTETTGLETRDGHRIIEIGCVEMVKRRLTGNHLHLYINPEREIDPGAFKVHGISNDFLQDKPVFKTIAEQFLKFIEGAELIIHNAPFDIGFMDYEFSRLGPQWPKTKSICKVLDTLVLARKKHAGQRNNLDALCKRYDIDNSNRDLHGALLDSEILAQVYLAMTRSQESLFSEASPQETKNASNRFQQFQHFEQPITLPVIKASVEEEAEHLAYMNNISV